MWVQCSISKRHASLSSVGRQLRNCQILLNNLTSHSLWNKLINPIYFIILDSLPINFFGQGSFFRVRKLLEILFLRLHIMAVPLAPFSWWSKRWKVDAQDKFQWRRSPWGSPMPYIQTVEKMASWPAVVFIQLVWPCLYMSLGKTRLPASRSSSVGSEGRFSFLHPKG